MSSTVVRKSLSLLVLAIGVSGAVAAPPVAAPATVCTITVNSADEKDAIRRQLPPGKYDYVELVERGRPDWLDSACRRGVKCDVLVISGHYDGGNEFFSDQVEAREFLPVDEMERVACGSTCPGLFSQLKEVYLFGCNTLNAEPTKKPSDEIVRSFVRSGMSRPEAERAARQLAARHGESARDRMRHVFKDVPAIYGFSSVAPLGPVAGGLLNRALQGGTSEFGTGRASSRVLNAFSAHAMTVTSGMRENDAHASHRRDICQFADDSVPAERTAGFVHSLLRRDMAEVRMFFDRLERYAAKVNTMADTDPAALDALGAIARDEEVRARYLEFARDADLPSVRSRMLGVAQDLGWLTAEQHRAELVALFNRQLASTALTAADVDLACSLNRAADLNQEVDRLEIPPAAMQRAAHAGVLACLGDETGHLRMLHALTSHDEEEVAIAQVYLRHRPLANAAELRAVTGEVVRMKGSPAQVRALQALSGHRFDDPESLEQLARLFPVATSAGVQTAIAGILVRADYRAIATPALVQSLQETRIKGASGPDMVDVLIRRLQATPVSLSAN